MEGKTGLLPEKIHLMDVAIIKGQIESPFEFDEEQVKGFDFRVGLDIGFKIEEKQVKADLVFEIKSESEPEQEEASGFFQFAFLLLVDNLEELTDAAKDKPEVSVDASLGNAVASISYSTARGILLTRFQGTALKDFILPVIDPNQLLR